MSIIITILTALVALEFVYIFLLGNTPNDFRSYKPRLQYEC